MTEPVIIPRSTIGVPDPGSRTKLAGSLRHLLAHYTGAGKYNDPTKDLVYAKSVASFGVSAAKPFEYNYLIGLGGSIFEQAGEYVAAHCKSFNLDSIGVLMMLSPGVQPTAAMIDSFRWLRWHLIATGALHLSSDAVPHYRYRSTECPGSTLAELPHGFWASPTGEGSLGDLHLPLLVPWIPPVVDPIPDPTPIPTPTPEDDLMIGIIENKDQYDAQFIGEYVGSGVFLNLRWIRTPKQVAAAEAHKAAGAKVFKFTKDQLVNCAVDVVPSGDRVSWTGVFAWPI